MDKSEKFDYSQAIAAAPFVEPSALVEGRAADPLVKFVQACAAVPDIAGVRAAAAEFLEAVQAATPATLDSKAKK